MPDSPDNGRAQIEPLHRPSNSADRATESKEQGASVTDSKTTPKQSEPIPAGFNTPILPPGDEEPVPEG